MSRRRYMLLVKGTDALAAEQARLRGCVVLTTGARNSDYACLHVNGEDRQIESWFLAGNTAPFPDGELMYYKEIANGEVQTA